MNLSPKNQARIEELEKDVGFYENHIKECIKFAANEIEFYKNKRNCHSDPNCEGCKKVIEIELDKQRADFLAWLYEIRGRNVMFDLDFEEIVSKKIKELSEGTQK